MVKNVKAIVITFIIFTLIMSITGCNVFKKGSSSVSRGADPYAEKQLGRETLTFYLPGYEPDGSKKIISEMEKRLADTLNVKLDFKWISKDIYFKTVKDELESGKRIDACILAKDDYHDEIGELAKEDKLADLTKLLEKETPKLFNLYCKEERENVTYAGKLLAIPAHFPTSNRISVVVRDNILKSIEETQISNFDNFTNVLGHIVSQTNALATLLDLKMIDVFAEAYGYVHLGNYLVYKWSDPEMKLIPWEQTPEFKESIDTLIKWKETGYVFNYNNMSKKFGPYGQPSINLFSSEASAATMLTTWKNAQYYKEILETPEDKVTIFPLYEDQYTQKPIDTVAVAINKNSKNIERVIRFLNWIQSSQENYDLFMYGIKDENYVLDNGKIVYLPNKIKYYGWEGSEAFLNINLQREQPEVGFTSKEEYLSAVEKNSKYPPSFGFKLETSTIQAFIDSRNKNYDDLQEKITFENTDKLRNVDDFIQQQKNAGVDKLVSSAQEQLHKWKIQKTNSN